MDEFNVRFKPGSRIRVKKGALRGLEGIVEERRSPNRLVVACDYLERHVPVEIDDFMCEPIGQPASGDAELAFAIDVPADASDEEIIQAVRDMALQADALHRAMGGRGLEVVRTEIHEWALEPEEAPNA